MVAPWSTHGPLQVSANGHYLHHADGTEFFWLGDTAWHLARLTPSDVERYLANRAAKGFTVIHLYATQDPNPRFGGQNYAGEIALAVEGPPFAQVTLNEAYWQHIDFILDCAKEYGLYIALAPAWGLNLNGGKRQYFTDPDQHNYTFGTVVGQRYSSQPNLIWIAAAEYQTPYSEPTPAEHRARVLRLVDGLLAGDSGDHLMTIHPLSRFTSSDDFHDAPWLAFNMIQTHVYHDYIDSLVSHDWQRSPAKPTLNAEGWYEAEEDLFTSRVGVQKTTLWEWDYDGDPLPHVGQLEIVLDGQGQPLCVTEIIDVQIKPYNEVDAAFAYAEGEDDRSLASWQREHWRYFSRVLPRIGRTPTETMPLVCVRFRVIFKA